MDIFLAITGLVVGGLVSWVVSHYYYKKQTKEQINPIPHIKGVHEAVLELHGIAIERRDEVLEKAIRTLLVELLHARMRVLDSVASALLLLKMIDDLRSSEDKDNIVTGLNELETHIANISKRLSEVGEDFEGLRDTGEQISGKKLEFTRDEFDAFLVSPKNNRRTPSK